MKRILVVEDNAPLCWLIERMLRGKYVVTLRHNVLDAIAWLSEGNACDLIITDLAMPEMTGLELLEFVKDSGINGDIPVIVLSANDDQSQECITKGASCFVLKPFNPQQLLAQIQTVISQRVQLLN